MRITGTDGRIETGGRLAARLAGYQFDGGTAGWTVRADCLEVDDFWLSAGGLALMLHVGGREWVWQNVTAIIAGSRIEVKGTGKPDIQELTDGA